MIWRKTDELLPVGGVAEEKALMPSVTRLSEGTKRRLLLHKQQWRARSRERGGQKKKHGGVRSEGFGEQKGKDDDSEAYPETNRKPAELFKVVSDI